MRLEGKTAWITGGTSGIGLAAARRFVREGARVAVTGRDTRRFAQVRDELGDDALVLAAEARSLEAMRAAARQVADAFGPLDIFFANAGVAFATPLEATDEAAYDELMDINVKSVFFSMQTAGPLLRDGASVILNTSFLTHVGRPGLSLLSASKAAVRSLARSWSSELLARRIRVNAVSPGYIDTPLHARRGGTPEEIAANKARFAARVPVGRLGSADEIAEAVLFLASDASRYIVGAELRVDGGISQL
ncbi:MAG: SDR family oxidoreductase [Burkholderia gladioli]